MRQVVIKAEHISKSFYRTQSHYGLKDILLHSFTFFQQRKRQRFTALKDISFELYSGESLAILGPNGAGKSTLLSLLAEILTPDFGKVKTIGKIGLMLELGSGFCHDLSGRENIILNGLLLGANRNDLKSQMEDIIDFSGVRDYIDEPLRTYSTGMQTRLGFSIAVHINPEIILIDEVLAVGDSEFNRRCLTKITEMRNSCLAFVLVTHSLHNALQFCDRALYLEKGRIRFAGRVQEVVDAIEANHCEY